MLYVQSFAGAKFADHKPGLSFHRSALAGCNKRVAVEDALLCLNHSLSKAHAFNQ